MIAELLIIAALSQQPKEDPIIGFNFGPQFETILMKKSQAEWWYAKVVREKNNPKLEAALKIALGTFEAGESSDLEKCKDTPQRCATISSRPATNINRKQRR